MSIYPADLITLERVREEKNIQEDADNRLLRRYIKIASEIWSLWTDRRFVPYVDTKKFGLSHVYGLCLDMGDDLLSVTTITNANGAVIDLSLYDLRPDNKDPKTKIELKSSAGAYWDFTYVENRIEVSGIWGYHYNYAVAWGDSLDTVKDATLNATTTTLTVDDTDADNDEGETRFGKLDYLLVGTEQMQVLDINVTDKTLTVKRGVNGTTAANHTQNDKIYTYRQTPQVQFAASEIVKWMYEHRDKVDGAVQLAENLGLVIARELPEIKEMAELYRRNRTRIKAV